MLLGISNSYAQSFRGKVVDVDGKPIPFAAVIWQGSHSGVTASDSGRFEMPFPPNTTLNEYRLNVSFGGLIKYFDFDDLHSFWTFTMNVKVELEVATVYDEEGGAYISRLFPFKTEIVARNEMRKAT